MTNIEFVGYGGNVIGSLSSGSLVQNMPPALQYNGTSTNFETNINISSSLGANNSTFSAWFRSEEGSGDGTILSGYVGSDPSRWDLWVDGDNSRIRFVEHDGNNDINYTFANNDTAWHQVTLTNDVTANTATLYFDGVLAGSCSVPNDLTTDGELQAGDGGGAGGFLSGSIRDVRMYNTELSVTQVPELFAGTFSDTTNLLIHYDLEDPTDTTPANQGSVSANGTVSNGAWDYSEYNLNQIGTGSVSGTATVSGGAWNLKNSSYIRPTGTNNTNANYIELNNDQQYDGSRSYAMWFYLSDTGSTQVILDNYLSNLGTQVFINGGTPNLYLRLNNTNVFNFAANVNEWNHLVWTIDETNNLAKGYLNSTEVTSVANNRTYGTVSNMRLGSNVPDTYPTNDGNYFSEYAYYTSVLTPTQINLLYKGQWIGSPETLLKMDEGTGTSITNHGTDGATATLTGVSSNIPVWVNPNYDITNVGAAANEGLTIRSGTTLSAPRGELLLRAASPAGDPPDWRINGKYIHNSGTLTFSGTTTTDWYPANEADNNNAYYKVKQAGTKPQWHNGSWTVEHSLNLEGNIRAYANSSHANGHTLTLGTTGSVGYVTGSAYIQAMTNTNGGSLIKSASENYPAVLSGTHASYGAIVSPYRSIQVSGVHMFGDCKTGNNGFENGSTLKILGNTVWGDKSGGGAEIMIPLTDSASNDTGQNLDVSGAAVHIKIPMYISGNMIVKDAAVVANKFMQSANRSFVSNDNSKIIYSHQTANNDNFIMPSISGQQMMNSNYRQYTNAAYDIKGDLIVGHTNTTGFKLNHNFTCRNIYVGDDANSVFNQNDKTLTVTGTKLSAVGGFIGACQGMFDNDPTTTPTEYITYASGQSMGSAGMTMEAWVNTSDTGDQIFLKLHDPYTYLKVDDDGKVYGRIGSNGITTELGSTTVCDDGKWHHVALTFKQGDGGSRLYIDGILEDQVEGDTGSVYSPNTFSIGADHSDMQKGLNGSLARVSVWKKNLSQDEILQMMFMDYLSVSSSAIDHTQCINWTQFDGKTNNTQVYNLASGSNNGTATTSDIWDVPNGYANWIGGTGSSAQVYLTSTEDVDFWGKNFRLSNVSGGATAGKKMKMTRWDGFEQCLQFYGAWKWGPGTLEQRNYSTYGDNAVPWCTAGNGGYVEEMSGTPFGDASNGLGSYWQSSTPTKEMTIRNMLPTDNVNLGGDLTIVGTMMPSLTSKSNFIDSHGYDMMLKQWKSYNNTIAELRLQEGSTLYFVNDNSGFSEGISSKSLIQIVASGEACAIFPGGTDGGNEIDLPAGVLESLPQSSFSISMWVNVKDDDYASYTGFFGGTPGKQFSIWRQSNDRIMFAVGGSANQFSIYPTVTSGVWYHIGMTYDGSTVKGYFDGTQTGSTSYAGAWTASVSTIGAYAPGGTATQDGKIADVRIFPTTLSDANFATLASENPATSVSGAYADPTNSLGAISWHKLGATPTGTLDISNFGTSGAAFNGSIDGVVKSGFTRILASGSTNAWEFNNGTGDKRLTNFYLSGSSGDIMVSNSGTANGAGNYYPGSLTTKGTVVFD